MLAAIEYTLNNGFSGWAYKRVREFKPLIGEVPGELRGNTCIPTSIGTNVNHKMANIPLLQFSERPAEKSPQLVAPGQTY